MKSCIPTLCALLALAAPALAKPTQTYFADYQARYTAAAPTENSAIQFIISGAGIQGGLQPGDVSFSIIKGSRFVSSLTAGQTLKLTRLQNGDLLVQMVGDVRSTFNNTQFLKFRVEINKPNVKALRISNPRWGDSDPANNNDFTPLGAATLNGGGFKLDPLFVTYNDLLGEDLLFRNLQFLDNVPQSVVDALDPETVFDAPYDSGLPQFTLPSGMSTDDIGVTLPIGPEPDDLNYLVAMGQIVDPASGEVITSFIHGVQAVPEPGALPFAAGAAFAAFAFRRRRRRAHAR